MKKILIISMACVLCLGLIGGAFAYFTDSETASNNTFVAGYMDLGIIGANDPSGLITLVNMAPGHASGDYVITFTNYGSLAGTLAYNINVVGEPAEPYTFYPDGAGQNMDAWAFAQQVFVTKLLWNGTDILATTISHFDTNADGHMSLSEIAAAPSLTDVSETLGVGGTDTVTYGFTLNPLAEDKYQGDGVIMNVVATLTSN